MREVNGKKKQETERWSCSGGKKLEKHWKEQRANEEDAAQVCRESRQVTGPGSLNTHRCAGRVRLVEGNRSLLEVKYTEISLQRSD